MTAKIGSATTAQVMQLITGASGLNSSLAALTQADQALAGPLDLAQVPRAETWQRTWPNAAAR